MLIASGLQGKKERTKNKEGKRYMQPKKPVSIRMHESIKEDLEKLSKKHDISVNTLVNMMLMSMIQEIKSGKRQIVSEIVASNEN